MALGDQIWREDISDNADYADSMTRTFHDLVQRATYQGAPPALIAKLTHIRDLAAEALDELRDVAQYFPKQP